MYKGVEYLIESIINLLVYIVISSPGPPSKERKGLLFFGVKSVHKELLHNNSQSDLEHQNFNITPPSLGLSYYCHGGDILIIPKATSTRAGKKFEGGKILVQ